MGSYPALLLLMVTVCFALYRGFKRSGRLLGDVWGHLRSRLTRTLDT